MLNHTAIYVVFVMFLATLIRSTVGFGEGLVAVPLLALRVPIAIAAPLAVLVSVLVAGVIVVQDHRKIEIRSAAGLIVSAMVGIPFGLFLLASVNDHVVKMALGVIIIVFSVYSLNAKTMVHLERDRWGWLLACGFCSGVLGGAYGMNGPPLAVYGALRRWSPQHFRATLQGYFFPASLMGLLGYGVLGIWERTVTRYCLLSLPGILAAVLIGRALNHRLRGHLFFRFVYAGLIVIGAILLSQALRP
ncbi:MAG TPA: sulfite exporter TauE/SafE family protein [Tepidisphaeraceae bacterium]|jgi:hypothetical protein